MSGDTRSREDSNDLYDTVYTAEQSRLQVAEAESCDDELLLIGEGVRYLVKRREERKEPGLWVPTVKNA